MTERADVKFQGNAPTRCPYGHDAVDRASDAWVACEGCLARHHAACWSETGACGACHETACVVPTGVAVERAAARPPSERAPAARKGDDDPLPADVAVHDLALQGDPPVWLSAEQALVVLARAPDAVEPLAVRVRNATDRPQRVEVRSAPAWLVRQGDGATAAPGETVTLRFDARVADAPFDPTESGGEERPLPRGVAGCGYRLGTSIVIGAGELAKLVPVDVVRPYSEATLRGWAWFLSLIFVMPFAYLNARSKAKPVTRGPGEPQASWLLRQRVAAESSRMAAIAEPILLKWLALICGLLIVLTVIAA